MLLALKAAIVSLATGETAPLDELAQSLTRAGYERRGPVLDLDGKPIQAKHPFAVVTCRAVAPMTKLSGWTLPLLERGGRLVALKGRSAQEEIEKASKEIAKCGGIRPRVVDAEVGPGLESTHVLMVDKK